MRMCSLLLLLLCGAIQVKGCPSYSTTTFNTWRVSFNITAATVYVEQLNNNTGYYAFSGVPFGSTTYYLSVHFYQGPGPGFLYPDPTTLGWQSNSSQNLSISGNELLYVGTNIHSFGWAVNQTGIRSFNFTPQSVYPCIGIGSPANGNYDVCINQGYIATGSSCVAYSACYPCDCGCTKNCYGPGVGFCCDSSCQSCFGPSNTMCVYCNSGFYSQPSSSSSCFTTCPAGYWPNSVGNVCSSCNAACATCTNSSTSSCPTCNTNYYLQPAPSTTTCSTTCPNGFYGNNSAKICSACNGACATCTNSGSGSCITCNTGYYLQPSPLTTTCSTTCPTGYYKNNSTNVCSPCNAACATCTNSGTSSCPTCNSNYYLQPAPSTTTCSSSCPPGYYMNNSTNTCSACNGACATCTNSSTSSCPTCNSNYYLQPVPLTTTCSSTCPAGYYENNATKICSSCNAACATCTNSSTSSCPTCNSNYYLQPSPSTTTCSTTCPAGYYKNNSTNACSPCNAACATCTNSGTSSCPTCNSNYYLQPAPSTNTCSPTCPTGYYMNNSTNTCSACNGACATCTNSGASSCLTCNSGYYLQLPPSTTTCLSTCSPGYYVNNSTDICIPCSTGCATCTNSGTNFCPTCSSGYYLQPSPSTTTCSSTCPTGYYPNTLINICSSCNPACATCTNSGNNFCPTCNSGYYLQLPPSTTTCLSTCSPGYYVNNSTDICIPCSTGCATCTNSGTNFCPTCSSGYYLQPSPSTTTCSSTCPDGYYKNNSTSICSTCDVTCKICTNSGNSYCITCNSGYYLQPFPLNTTCLLTCPPKYHGDSSTGSCQLDNELFAGGTATTFSVSLLTIFTALQGTNTASGMIYMHLVLCLSPIESIANMQYLNINHSTTALEAYQGLGGSIFPNWIANFNSLESSNLIFNYGILEKNQISALYLDNYGDSLTGLLIYAGICLSVKIISLCQSKDKVLKSSIGKIYCLTFGLFLSNVLGAIQNQILFSIMQILKVSLFVDSYSQASYFTAYVTMSIVIGLHVYCVFELKSIFIIKKQEQKRYIRTAVEDDRKTELNVLWTIQKYEMLFAGFKDDNRIRFFFFCWLTAFNTTYILLILSLQAVPVLQCISITILVLAFLIFSAIVKPMKDKLPAFLFFFNFTFILLLAIINLVLAIRDTWNLQFLEDNTIGWVIFSLIMVNTGVNIIVGSVGAIFRIYTRLQQQKKTKAIHQLEKNGGKPVAPKSEIINFVNQANDLNLNALKIVDLSGINEGDDVSESENPNISNQYHTLRFIAKRKVPDLNNKNNAL